MRKLTLAAAKLLLYERPHCATRWGASAVRWVGKQKKRYQAGKGRINSSKLLQVSCDKDMNSR